MMKLSIAFLNNNGIVALETPNGNYTGKATNAITLAKHLIDNSIANWEDRESGTVVCVLNKIDLNAITKLLANKELKLETDKEWFTHNGFTIEQFKPHWLWINISDNDSKQYDLTWANSLRNRGLYSDVRSKLKEIDAWLNTPQSIGYTFRLEGTYCRTFLVNVDASDISDFENIFKEGK